MTPEQAKLLEQYPGVNIIEASLATLDLAAADELKQMNDRIVALRGTKPIEDFIRAFDAVPQSSAPHATVQPRRSHPAEANSRAGRVERASRAGQSRSAGRSLIPTTGRRLSYVRWLTSGRHPLTVRVLMNRFWMHHFGRGIVDTPANFGTLGVTAHAPRTARLPGR